MPGVSCGPETNDVRFLRGAMIVMAAAALALPPAHAIAQDAPPAAPPAADRTAEMAERKKAGDQAMEALRYEDALAAYGDVYAVTKDPAMLYNMGRSLQALNRFPEALAKLRAFEVVAPPDLKARVPRLAKLIAEIRDHVSTLTITTNVEGARIVVRSTVVGKSPLPAPLELVSGPAEIEIDAEGYFPAKKSVVLAGASELKVQFDLNSRATTGMLAVKASVPHAEVLVDGKRIGIAPVEVNVAKGDHKITVKHPDYRLFETAAVVEAGRTKTVTATLQTPPIVRRWWFWTIVGAAVAGGAAAAIAGSIERPPDSGTIAPGKLPTAYGARRGTFTVPPISVTIVQF